MTPSHNEQVDYPNDRWNAGMSLNPTVEWGTFYSGTRQQVATKLALRVRPGVIVYLNHEWNRIDLPEGRLRTQVFEATPEFQFS